MSNPLVHRQSSLAVVVFLCALAGGLLSAATFPPPDDPGWPRWRGPHGDGSAVDPGYPLVADIREARLVWTSEQEIPPPHDEGMKQIWTGGYASPIVAEGKVFLYYFLPHGRQSPHFDENDVRIFGPKAKSQHSIKKDDPWEAWHVDDIVQAFDARTGAVLWTFRDPRGLTEEAGKSGGHHTPCYDQGRVYAMGTSGRLYALDAAKGETIWEAYPDPAHADAFERSQQAGKSVLEGTGFNMIPCAIDGVVAIGKSLGNRRTVVGFHGATGERLWEVDVDGGGQGGRGNILAPVVWEHGGRSYFIAGNSCIEPRTGKVLWAIPGAQTTTSPCVTGRYYICSVLEQDGQRMGSSCFRISPLGFEHVWSMPEGRKPAMGCTDAVSGDHFIQATDDRVNTAQLIDLHSGAKLAEIESFRDLGYGPVTCRGVLYGGMYDRTSFRLDPQSFEKFEGQGRDQWGNSTSPALAYGHLYHRTGHRLVCLDLRAR